MLATLTIVPLSGNEWRVAEPTAPKEGESHLTYLNSLSFVFFVLSAVNDLPHCSNPPSLPFEATLKSPKKMLYMAWAYTYSPARDTNQE